MSATQITHAFVNKLLELARLKANDQNEIVNLVEELNQSLSYSDNLSEIDVSEVDQKFYITDSVNVWQEDEVDESVILTGQQATQNSRKSKDGYFIVDKIL